MAHRHDNQRAQHADESRETGRLPATGRAAGTAAGHQNQTAADYQTKPQRAIKPTAADYQTHITESGHAA